SATTSAGWFSSSEWRLRPLECAHGWSPRGVVQTDRAVARQASKRFSIGDSPWLECCNRLAQLRQKSPKAGIVRGGHLKTSHSALRSRDSVRARYRQRSTLPRARTRLTRRQCCHV